MDFNIGLMNQKDDIKYPQKLLAMKVHASISSEDSLEKCR
ncbi:hypothetical protein UF75_2190 [Desulfosporosinus sp. I2]|nr:hypothetical protein UF75_2190 [Desulfosporosinus sp. I2]